MRKGIAEQRPYAPDFVSLETLAYRLDCALEEVESLLKSGALPKPHMIGHLRRWDFAIVRACVARFGDGKVKVGRNGLPGADSDPYLAALETPG